MPAKSTVTYTQEVLDLNEPMIETIHIKIQPSLKAVFRQRCESDTLGPIDYSDQIRRLIAMWVKDTKSRTFTFE